MDRIKGTLIQNYGPPALGLTYLNAGAVKLVDLAAFLNSVEGFRLLPRDVAVVVTFFPRWMEIVAGAGTWWWRTKLGALAILTGLNGIFAVVVASALIRGLNITCGCFGGDGKTSLVISLARAMGLMGFSGVLILLVRRRHGELGTKPT